MVRSVRDDPWTSQVIVQLSLLAAAAFVYVVAETIPVCALTAIAQGFHISEALVGTLLSWYSFIAAVTTVPLVRKTSLWPRRRVFVLTLVLLVISQLISAWAPNFMVLTIARVICAFTHGLMWSVIAPLATRLVPASYAGRATTAIYIGTTLASVLGNPLVAMLSVYWGWRYVMVTVAGLGALIALGARWVLPAMPVRSLSYGAEQSQRAEQVLARYPAKLFQLNIVTFLAVTAHFISYTFIVVIIRDVFVANSVEQAWFLTAFGIAGLIAVPLVAKPIDRYPRCTVLVCSIMLMVVFGGLAGLAGVRESLWAGSAFLGIRLSLWGVVVIALWGGTAMALSPMLQSATMSAIPDHPDEASSAYVTAFQIGITVGALCGGFLYEHYELVGMLASSSVLMGIMVVVLVRQRMLFCPVPSSCEGNESACTT